MTDLIILGIVVVMFCLYAEAAGWTGRGPW